MKYRVTLFFGLCALAVAQVLGGLPENGVTLANNEPSNSPVLVNHSGKTILGVVAQKNKRVFGILYLPPMAQPIPDGASFSLLGAAPDRLRIESPSDDTDPAITPATLDLVIFADGQVIGPNAFNLMGEMEKRLASISEIGQKAHDGKWLELQGLHDTRDTKGKDMDAWAAAYQLVATRNRRGNSDSDDLAEKYRALPKSLKK